MTFDNQIIYKLNSKECTIPPQTHDGNYDGLTHMPLKYGDLAIRMCHMKEKSLSELAD